uniref:Uncharacterized protein n=1 Tax=Heterosigma akashiwo TaxID=2829 RepID=A0A6V1PKT4_HETAK
MQHQHLWKKLKFIRPSCFNVQVVFLVFQTINVFLTEEICKGFFNLGNTLVINVKLQALKRLECSRNMTTRAFFMKLRSQSSPKIFGNHGLNLVFQDIRICDG